METENSNDSQIVKRKKVQKDKESSVFLTSDKAFTFYCNVELKERGIYVCVSERERASSQRKLPYALLHHCRSASPSSSPGCPPLDTLNWIPVRCAALPWVSFLRVTEHWAVCVCVFPLCVCACIFVCEKLTSVPYKNCQHKKTDANK